MEILHVDQVVKIGQPDYNTNNPLVKIMDLIEKFKLCAEREYYSSNSLQWLFPIEKYESYGPSGDDNEHDPRKQDTKTDFQKQNVQRFYNADTAIIRGSVKCGNWEGPFLHISYRGDIDSKLSEAAGHKLSEQIKLWIRVGPVATPQLITLPYNSENQRYEVELWGYPGPEFAEQLSADQKANEAFIKGQIIARPDLVKGTVNDFADEIVGNQPVAGIFPDHTLHPILPLHLELAFATEDQKVWDSKDGANYHYEFSMIVRGFDNYLARGISENPHGGLGYLTYRNLLSNYGQYKGSPDLGRTLEEWNFNAFGKKGPKGAREDFLAVDYMDLHVVNPESGIGLHRHRDNSEIFLNMGGNTGTENSYMIIGDWCKMPGRDRALEVRKLRAGHFAMLKGGNLHGLINYNDVPIKLFMFGGYD